MSFKELQDLVAEVGPEIETLDIEIAGHKKQIRIKHLSFNEANDIGSAIQGPDGKVDKAKVKEYRIKMLHRSIVDEAGNPDCSPEWLAGLRNSIFDSLETQVLKGLSLLPDAAEAAKGN